MEETFKDTQYLNSFFATFNELRNDQKLFDVVIATSDGAKFPCQKIILMGGCPFFKGLFSSDMVECRQNEVNLHPIDISGSLFKQILEFIYTGEIKLNFETAKAVNIYAGLFTMKNLKDITEYYLIKNITNETCLELWRHSEKYFNDQLKESCLLSANSEDFLDTHVENLTIEEIQSIVSLKKLNSKILLKSVVKWIKTNFEDRQQYIKELMELINFDDIKDEEYQRQLFSDEILMENKDFLKLATKYLLLKLSRIQNIVDVPKKTLFVLTKDKICYTDFDKKQFIATKLCPDLSSYATSCHNTNGFVITGGFNDGGKVNLCTHFCPSESVQKQFPKLINARFGHRNYTVGSKIYACGGFNETVEIFEENAGKWIRGPSMNTERQEFGAADDGENSLYAIGGLSLFSKDCNSVERLDIRMKSWQTIYSDPSVKDKFTQSLYKGDQIYCFGEEGSFIFDIRANKNFGEISYKLDSTRNLEFHTGFNCTVIDNDIWMIASAYACNIHNVSDISEITDAFKLDLKTNTWETKSFSGLDIYEDFGLVWCRNN